MLAEKGVELVTEFNTGARSTVAAGKLVGYDGREVPFDLAVVVPVHSGAEYVGRSARAWATTSTSSPPTAHPAVARPKPNVFALGDATDVPTSKAGSVTHFEGEVLVENIIRFLAGEELEAGYDGHANCFIETGFHKALLIDFNYDTEPLPGHFPAKVGLPLLKESRMNHLGKLMFQWVYWHALLPGRDIPGIGADDAHRRQGTRRRPGLARQTPTRTPDHTGAHHIMSTTASHHPRRRHES
jgi:sulfide:quinone oxidoreductase